jgi:predicted alternative tryptophan synthase beta-subunit
MTKTHEQARRERATEHAKRTLHSALIDYLSCVEIENAMGEDYEPFTLAKVTDIVKCLENLENELNWVEVMYTRIEGNGACPNCGSHKIETRIIGCNYESPDEYKHTCENCGEKWTD